MIDEMEMGMMLNLIGNEQKIFLYFHFLFAYIVDMAQKEKK